VVGNELVNAPEWQVLPSVDFEIPFGSWGSADVNVNAAYFTKQYFDLFNSPVTSQDAYTIVNASFRVHPEGDRWGLSVWAKNLTDEFAYSYMANASSVGFIFTQQNQPRTYGATVDFKF
jgi:iron complex outermembrane recepter protein